MRLKNVVESANLMTVLANNNVGKKMCFSHLLSKITGSKSKVNLLVDNLMFYCNFIIGITRYILLIRNIFTLQDVIFAVETDSKSSLVISKSDLVR